MADKPAPPKVLSSFGKRLKIALDEEGVSPTMAGKRFGFGPNIHKLMYGERGAETLDTVERFVNMAKALHVELEWLVTGRGSMRRGGRGPTPAEEAITTARKNGCREDALRNAWENNREKEHVWTFADWGIAIDAEARRLDRAGVPRPEIVQAKQEATQRLVKRKKRAEERSAAVPPPASEKKKAV